MNQVTDVLDNYIRKVEGVTIPKGFCYVGGTKEDGIVISDNKADENKYSKEKYADQSNIPADGLVGNQFVWIPVENINDFKIYRGYYNNNLQGWYGTEPYAGSETEKINYNKMKQSVEENKGFYIARYEAGKENIDGIDTVVSKKGATVWNNIAWGDSMTEIGSKGAVAKAQGMYNDYSTYAVTSTLVYGTQWDAIMTWIDPNYKTSNCDKENSFVANSTGKGNYNEEENTNEWKNRVTTCGSSDNYRVKNIYDLAGNVDEWTMESYSTNSRINRGGSYDDPRLFAPASIRGSIDLTSELDNVGFRVALYL